MNSLLFLHEIQCLWYSHSYILHFGISALKKSKSIYRKNKKKVDFLYIESTQKRVPAMPAMPKCIKYLKTQQFMHFLLCFKVFQRHFSAQKFSEKRMPRMPKCRNAENAEKYKVKNYLYYFSYTSTFLPSRCLRYSAITLSSISVNFS